MAPRKTAFLFKLSPDGESPFEIQLDVPAKTTDLKGHFRDMHIHTASLYPLPVAGVVLYLDDSGMLRGAQEPVMDRNTALMDILTNFVRKASKGPPKSYLSPQLQDAILSMWTYAPMFGGAVLVFETRDAKAFQDDLREFIRKQLVAKSNPNIRVVLPV